MRVSEENGPCSRSRCANPKHVKRQGESMIHTVTRCLEILYLRRVCEARWAGRERCCVLRLSRDSGMACVLLWWGLVRTCPDDCALECNRIKWQLRTHVWTNAEGAEAWGLEGVAGRRVSEPKPHLRPQGPRAFRDTQSNGRAQDRFRKNAEE